MSAAAEQPHSLDLVKALRDELKLTPSGPQAADNLLARYPAAAVRRWLWQHRRELLAALAGYLARVSRSDVPSQAHEGFVAYTPGPRLIGAHNPPGDRYGLPAPYLDKFIRDLTVPDVDRIIASYEKHSAELVAKAEAWRKLRALAAKRQVATLAELEAAGVVLPEGI
jgi:hypothetical protein